MAEYLSKDILHDSFIKSFSPFHQLQMMLGSCRVDARHCFVTAPTVFQKLYSVVLVTLTSVCYVLFVVYYDSVLRERRSLFYLIMTIFGFHHFFAALNIFHVRFLNNEQNIKFFIQLHEIDRSMKIDKKAYVHDVFYNRNLMTVTIWAAITIGLFLINVVNDWRKSVSFIWMFYTEMTYVLEWMYFSNLVIYFYMRVRYINSILINHLGIVEDSYSKMHKFLKYFHKTSLQELAAETTSYESADTDVYLKEIFDALLQFASLFRFQMFIFCTKFIFLMSLSVEFLILALQINAEFGINRLIQPLALLADFMTLITICVRWDDFFKELGETKNFATNILATHTTGPLRKKATAMIKLIEESPPHFSVYDMWNMDASILLNVLGILTTTTITLIQFALL